MQKIFWISTSSLHDLANPQMLQIRSMLEFLADSGFEVNVLSYALLSSYGAENVDPALFEMSNLRRNVVYHNKVYYYYCQAPENSFVNLKVETQRNLVANACYLFSKFKPDLVLTSQTNLIAAQIMLEAHHQKLPTALVLNEPIMEGFDLELADLIISTNPELTNKYVLPYGRKAVNLGSWLTAITPQQMQAFSLEEYQAKIDEQQAQEATPENHISANFDTVADESKAKANSANKEQADTDPSQEPNQDQIQAQSQAQEQNGKTKQTQNQAANECAAVVAPNFDNNVIEPLGGTTDDDKTKSQQDESTQSSHYPSEQNTYLNLYYQAGPLLEPILKLNQQCLTKQLTIAQYQQSLAQLKQEVASGKFDLEKRKEVIIYDIQDARGLNAILSLVWYSQQDAELKDVNFVFVETCREQMQSCYRKFLPHSSFKLNQYPDRYDEFFKLLLTHSFDDFKNLPNVQVVEAHKVLGETLLSGSLYLSLHSQMGMDPGAMQAITYGVKVLSSDTPAQKAALGSGADYIQLSPKLNEDILCFATLEEIQPLLQALKQSLKANAHENMVTCFNALLESQPLTQALRLHTALLPVLHQHAGYQPQLYLNGMLNLKLIREGSLLNV